MALDPSTERLSAGAAAGLVAATAMGLLAMIAHRLHPEAAHATSS